MTEEIIVDVVKKLIGDISPKGCSNRDRVILTNIDILGKVICSLAIELNHIKSVNCRSYESSVSECGQKAHFYLRELNEITNN